MRLYYLENHPNYPPLPWWERAGVRGEYAMITPTPAYRQAGSPSPIKGEGRWVEFSLFVSDDFIMKN
jgi:hypothetical protein